MPSTTGGQLRCGGMQAPEHDKRAPRRMADSHKPDFLSVWVSVENSEVIAKRVPEILLFPVGALSTPSTSTVTVIFGLKQQGQKQQCGQPVTSTDRVPKCLLPVRKRDPTGARHVHRVGTSPVTEMFEWFGTHHTVETTPGESWHWSKMEKSKRSFQSI